MPIEPADRLIGWKSIAAYLGRDIRTVQRWEAAEGLPIHRLEHQRQGSAYAFRSELDEWQNSRSIDPRGIDAKDEPPRSLEARWRRWAPLAGGLLVAIGAVVLVASLLNRGTGPKRLPGEDTDNAPAYAAYAEGKALYAARQYRQAIAALDRAVSRDPKFGSAWALLAKVHGRLAQPVWAGGTQASARATECAERAATLAPNSADTRIALALAARARSDVATWRTEAQRAVALDSHAAEAYALLADSYAAVIYACNRDQDPERAEEYYRKALELAPDSTTAISNRAGNLRRMGRYKECIELLDKSVGSFRDEPPLRATRGVCRMLAGDMKGATDDIEALRGNQKIAPAGVLLYLGLLDLKTGKTDQGVGELERAVQASPSSRTHLIVAETYATAGDIDRSVEHMKLAFAKNPECAGLVDTSLAFKSVRDTPKVKDLLATYGVR